VDFYQIRTKETKSGETEVYPSFIAQKSKDLMIRGGSFYAIWDEAAGLWSQDPFDVQRLIDEELKAEAKKKKCKAQLMTDYDSRVLTKFNSYMKELGNHFRPLDTSVIFANTEVKREDYVSKKLPYPLMAGSITAWDELVGTLYSPEERAKLEWAIGSVVSGDSKVIQKFLVLYGAPGTGKSTILRILEAMFQGYTCAFDSRDLGSSNSAFAMEVFRDHPLVAINHDGDLSRMDSNRFNSIVSHEEMVIDEKYKTKYTSRIEAMMFIGTNQPVKISDAKSGMLRRLLDVVPTGMILDFDHYTALMEQILQFELGSIAHHCLTTYKKMGRKYYDGYIPVEQQLYTDVFFNFIEENFHLFKEQDHTTLKQAWTLYKEFCDEAEVRHRLQRHQFRMELMNYFHTFSDRGHLGGKQVSSLYEGFTYDKFRRPVSGNGAYLLVLDETKSGFDDLMADQPAQLAKDDGTPRRKWSGVRTKLRELDTAEVHFLKLPPNHVVIDFDLESLAANLEAASHWPSTYAELSKSGTGIHLHYDYEGEVSQLAPKYDEGIEIKTFQGDASLRRKLSWCNSLPVAKLNSGLPLKKQEKMLKTKTITSEQGLRDLIYRNLRKEIHPGTKPSVDFIKKILDDAYEEGMTYDVTDLRPGIIAFANNSTNQASNCLKVVREMKWASENPGGEIPGEQSVEVADERIAFFDVEVYPNLFVVCWKFQDADQMVRMVNPKAHEIEALFKLKLVGFYNRRYDNHILYAAAMGAPPAELFKLSTKLIAGNRSATFGAAYNLSYADIWDFSTERQSLKKFEIKLGILHMELDLPWDQPVEDKDVERVVKYCENDVKATEAVFEDRKADFKARQILAALSGLSVNDTTQAHTAKIVFGDDKEPQRKFEYTKLSDQFPGYTFAMGRSDYRGEDPGEGGYVYAEPGTYEKVAVLDVVSMHPKSIELLNLFGPYTKKYAELTKARVAIKAQDYDKARALLDGKLEPFLVGAEQDEAGRHGTDLAFALRIALNIVYGLTSAKFDNPFRDHRNIDNIVAKRGALFMIELKHMIQEEGYQVVHIKTDSVKIPNADPRIIAKVLAFGQMWGYEFDHEADYDVFCLVNDAVYVAGNRDVPWDPNYPSWEWSATGAQFQHPYVFKTLFSGEELTFTDFCEARSVQKGAMYLYDGDEEMRHVGRTGLFVPVTEGGYTLKRKFEDKTYAVSGTKDHLWIEAYIAQTRGDDLKIDMSYFDKLRDAGYRTLEAMGLDKSYLKGAA
jgi:Family of unknown function (DUF5906)